MVSERATESESQSARESKCVQWPPLCSSHCVINMTLQVESSGNFLANRPLGGLQGSLADTETPTRGLVMFPLSAYQSHTVHSMNPASSPSFGLLPLNSIASQRARRRISHPSQKRHTNEVWTFYLCSLKFLSWHMFNLTTLLASNVQMRQMEHDLQKEINQILEISGYS